MIQSLPTGEFPVSGQEIAMEMNNRQYQGLRRIFIIVLFFLTASLMRPGNAVAQETLMGLTSNGGAEGGGTIFSMNTNGSGFEVVKTFANWGKNPGGGLVAGKDSNYYGMTYSGGIYNDGTIFSINSAGKITILHNFNSVTDGANPYGDLILAPDGNFYGMTNAGGTNTYGTIFKFSLISGYSVMRHFSYATDGANPFGSLVIGKDGHFYGVTRKGGTTGYGTIFRITAAGIYTVLKAFSADPKVDGNSCYGSLTVASDSSLYGVNYSGGTYGNGTIFKMTPKGEFTVLRHLQAATDGYAYTNSLLEAPDGNLYGINYYGGTYGQGTIFRISKKGEFAVLRQLISKTDGSGPSGSLVLVNNTELIGMCKGGGLNGFGTVFSITTGGVFKLLKSFNSPIDGAYPKGSLTKGIDGNFFGMTSDGGAGFYGTVFRVSSKGIFSVLNNMNGGMGGNTPMESLVQDKTHAYYGTTLSGGAFNHGTIFKICGNVYSVVKNFNKTLDGGMPKGTLIEASDGNFYGTTTEGGQFNSGTIFRLTPSGAYSVIYHLSSTKDGGNPQSALTEGAPGLLYGTCNSGGTTNGGTIFRVSTAGAYTVLKQLNTATDGSNPEGGLVKISDSLFYGLTMNASTIYKISSTGNFQVVKKFSTTADGNYPAGTMVRAGDNQLYGITNSGGSFGGGTIFRLNSAGVFQVVKHLNPNTEGSQAKGSLVMAKDGHLYGMTSNGGTGKAGTIFRITTANAFTVLRSFNIKTDGGTGFGSLIVQKPNPLVAIPQTVQATEDVLKAITLVGQGATPLTYTITTAPKNGTINAGNTAARTYTPAKNYAGKDSFYFRVNYGCLQSAPAKVVINIAPVDNDAPVLDSVGTKSVTMGSVLSFQPAAKEFDAGQILTWSISAAPAGAVIDAKTGFFRWTTNTTGLYTMKLRVSDNGKPILFDEETITLKVNPNSAPVLDSIGIKIVKVSTLLSFTSKAKDVDSGQLLSYSLLTAPAGAVIDTKTGVFKWTPTVSGVFKFTVKVADNGIPVMNDTELITVSVVTNLSPVLDSVKTKTVTTGVLLGFKLTAKDPDAGQLMKYKMTGAPATAKLDSTTGTFSWTPLTAGTFKINFMVSDNGQPQLNDAELVTIVVKANVAPVLDSIRAKTIAAGKPLAFKVTAKDGDIGQKLSYTLVGAPAGAIIVAGTGDFNWTPATGGIYTLRFRVTDNGSPQLLDEELVKVTVTAAVAGLVANSTFAETPGGATPSVYPNPVSSTCVIDLKSPLSRPTVSIVNSSGTSAGQLRPLIAGETLIKLDLSKLSTGVYFVSVVDGDRKWTVRLLKQ